MNAFGVCAVLAILWYSLLFNWAYIQLFVCTTLGYFFLSWVFVPSSAMNQNKTRRKIMIATWGTPTSPEMFSKVVANYSQCEVFLKDLSERTDVTVTLTHLCVKALAETFKKFPELCGGLVFGGFVPYTSVPIDCYVDNEKGEPTRVSLKYTDQLNLITIAKECQRLAAQPKKPSALSSVLPTCVIGILIEVAAFLSSVTRISLPLLGGAAQKPCAVLANLEKYDVDLCYSPFDPTIRSSTMVNVLAPREHAVVRGTEVVVEKQVWAMFSIDRRYINEHRAAAAQDLFKAILEQPQHYFSE